MKIAAAFLVLLCAANVSANPHPLSAEDLVSKTAAAYQNLSSYEFHVTSSTQILANGVMQQLIETNINLIGMRPDRIRLELQSARTQLLIIQSGSASYSYPQTLNLGQVQELVFAGITDDNSTNLPLNRASNLLISRYATFAKRAKDARIVGEENIDLLTGRRKCYVVQMGEADAPETYWIDQANFLVLRSVVVEASHDPDTLKQIKTTVTYKSAQSGQPVDARLFALNTAPAKASRERGSSASDAPGAQTSPRPVAARSGSKPQKATVLSVKKVKPAGE